MMMVRFFCDEMGLYLPKGEPDIKSGTAKNPTFKIKPFTESEAKTDPEKHRKLLIVLKAANRAVAHVNPTDVDHPIKTQKDHEILFETIDWIEELIQTHMYDPNDKFLKDAMKLPNNVM